MCSVWQLIFIIFCCMHVNSCRANRIWEAAIIIANDTSTIDHELVHETVHITVFWEPFWPVTIHACTSTACTIASNICACAPIGYGHGLIIIYYYYAWIQTREERSIILEKNSRIQPEFELGTSWFLVRHLRIEIHSRNLNEVLWKCHLDPYIPLPPHYVQYL